MNDKSFKIYIIRLLKSITGKMHISKQMSNSLDSCMRTISSDLVNKALLLCASEGKKTMYPIDIETGVQMFFPRDIINSVTENAKVAVENFENSEKGEKAQTREFRSGLIFSVSTAEKYIRRFDQVGCHVAGTTPVYLASVLQTFCKNLLERCISIAQEHERVTMTVRHLFLSLCKNEEVYNFVNRSGIVFLSTGVEPQQIETKKHKKINKKSKKVEGDIRSHRWRPGTKTAMQIRQLQKNNDLLIQRAPFIRLVREVCEKVYPAHSFRLTKDFFTVIQTFVEERCILLMQKSNKLAIHSGRETVYARDVVFVRELFDHSKSVNQYESNIPEAPIRQLSLRAGIQRFGDCSADEYRSYIISLLETICYSSSLCASHHKIQTLNVQLLIEGLNMQGYFPAIVPSKRKISKKREVKTEEVEE